MEPHVSNIQYVEKSTEQLNIKIANLKFFIEEIAGDLSIGLTRLLGNWRDIYRDFSNDYLELENFKGYLLKFMEIIDGVEDVFLKRNPYPEIQEIRKAASKHFAKEVTVEV